MAAPPATFVGLPLTDRQVEAAVHLDLPSASFRELRDAWRREGLPEAAWVVLVETTFHLADFERFHRPSKPNSKRLLDELRDIEEAASSLRRSIGKLSTAGLMTFDRHLLMLRGPKAETSEADNPVSPELRSIVRHAIAIERASCVAMAAARNALAERVEKQSATALPRRRVKVKAGVRPASRTETIAAQAGHLAALAVQLAPHGAGFDSRGKFRRMCDAVFQAANVHSTAEEAWRHCRANFRDPIERAVRATAAPELGR